MPAIAKLTKNGNTFEGTLHFIGHTSSLVIKPTTGDHEKGPDFRIFSDGFDVGGLWNRISNTSGNPFTAGQISSPLFPDKGKIYVNLTRDGETDEENKFVLLWKPPAD